MCVPKTCTLGDDNGKKKYSLKGGSSGAAHMALQSSNCDTVAHSWGMKRWAVFLYPGPLSFWGVSRWILESFFSKVRKDL